MGLRAAPSTAGSKGSGGTAPSARRFCKFKKQLNFRPILAKINAFLTWHRNKQCKNMIKLAA